MDTQVWFEMNETERAYHLACYQGNMAEADRLQQLVDATDAAREQALDAPGAKYKAAVWYAQQGFHVHPTLAGAKKPATLHGLLDATINVQTVHEWWTRNPDYNVALRTGYRFDVIDVDYSRGGRESFAKLLHDGHVPEILGVVKTPDGRHYYIHPTGDGNTTNLLPGIDYRGDGGYVVAPPSRNVAGRPDVKVPGTYRWAHPLELNKLK